MAVDIEYIGEIGEAEKEAFLGNAAALLFPIDWPEPFGLVVIEAMACGTPVIAWDNGAMPEIIDEGVTGFIVRLDRARRSRRSSACRELDRDAGAARSSSSASPRRAWSTTMRRSTRAWPTQSAGPRAVTLAGEKLNLDWPEQVTAWRMLDERQLDPAVALTTLDDAAPREPHRQFALKHGDCFVVADDYGDIRGRGDGLFRDDTRVLSQFRLLIGGRPPSLLGARCQPGQHLLHRQSDQPAADDGGRKPTPQGVIHIERIALALAGRHVRAADACPTTATARPSVPLTLRFAADFRDMFEVRGSTRSQTRPVL